MSEKKKKERIMLNSDYFLNRYDENGLLLMRHLVPVIVIVNSMDFDQIDELMEKGSIFYSPGMNDSTDLWLVESTCLELKK